MKKILLILFMIFFITTISTYLFINNISEAKEYVQKENSEYEYYLDKKIYGTELATLINKAIDKNERNQIQKDKKCYYIENDENTIRIEIKMKATEKTYPMEEIYNNNITEFVKYFNLAEFKCINIEYHKKTGIIAKMFFQEVE